MASFGKSYKGFYKDIYVRSYNEFLYAMYLDLIENKKFLSENVVLYDNKGKKKNPDFIILDEDNNIIEYIELKSTFEENEQLICEYVNCNINLKGIKIRFVSYGKNVKKYIIKMIIEKIGKEEFNRISIDFKSLSPRIKVQSFFGESNGMYGKKHSKETRELISKSCARPGELNGMVGKNHSYESKKLISDNSQWKDLDNKKEMQKKGMIKHFSRFTDINQREILTKYINDILINVKCVRPNILNRAYTLNKGKIVDLFGSITIFKIKMKELNYDIIE
jgi:hypothetical protein